MISDNWSNLIKRRPALAAGRALAVALLVSAGCQSLGQQAPCTVPVNIITPDFSSYSEADANREIKAWKDMTHGEPTRTSDFTQFLFPLLTVETDLPAKAFLAREKGHAVYVESVAINRGPRRIAFVADNGQEMVEYGRRAESGVIEEILSKARPEDSFALLTVGGPRVAVPFGSTREAAQAAAGALANPAQGKPEKQSALQGILEAASWLQPPQPGDSIVVISVLAESKHNATFSMVRRAVSAGRIRVFYIGLGGNVPPLHWDWPEEGGDSSPGDMYLLVGASGGLRVTYRSLEELKDNAEQMYKAIAEYYVLQVSSISPNLNISLSPEFQKRLPMVMFLYPWNLPPCSSQPTTKP